MKFLSAAALFLALLNVIAFLPLQVDAKDVSYPASEHSGDHKDRFETFWAAVELRKDQRYEPKRYRDATKEMRKMLKEQSKKLRKEIKAELEAGSDQKPLDKLAIQFG